MSESMDKIIKANYQDPGLPEYVCNPFISALPPIRDMATAAKEMRSVPEINEVERFLPPHIRAHAVLRVSRQFFQPISQHLMLEAKLGILIRQGYISRNPDTTDFKKHLNNGYDRIVQNNIGIKPVRDVDVTACAFSFVGTSGCGKSTSIFRALEHYPPAIYHEKLGIIQIPWIKIECSRNGSLEDLCRNFFMALDKRLGTNYQRDYSTGRWSVGRLVTQMAQLAILHAVGVIIVDEVQNLSRQKSGGDDAMINFFVLLVNTVNVPVVLVGTPKARRLFTETFSLARRSTGMGNISWDRLQKDENWDHLIDKLFKYQWLHHTIAPSKAIKDVLYELCQGIWDILIKLFVLSQCRAMVVGVEELSENLIRQVYKDELTAVHAMLEALRSGDKKGIERYSDLQMPKLDERVFEIFANEAAYHDIKKAEKKMVCPGEDHEKIKQLLEIAIKMGIESDIALPMIEHEIKLNPELDVMRIVHKLTGSMSGEVVVEKKLKKSTKKTNIDHWGNLEADDLRYLFFNKKDVSMNEVLKRHGTAVYLEDLLKAG